MHVVKMMIINLNLLKLSIKNTQKLYRSERKPETKVNAVRYFANCMDNVYGHLIPTKPKISDT